MGNPLGHVNKMGGDVISAKVGDWEGAPSKKRPAPLLKKVQRKKRNTGSV